MKLRFFYTLMCGAILLSSRPASGAEIAGGVVIGEPTGFSLRIENFPVLSFGWSLSRDYVFVNCDYWLLNRPIPDTRQLDWYLGIGGAVGAGGNHGFIGCRVPVGIQAVLEQRFELFGELAPGLGLAPDVTLFVHGGIGFRYIF